MKITFNDSQTLQVQSISASGGVLRVSVLNNSYQQLKHLFTDQVTTAKITTDTGVVYENYIVFSGLTEKPGGIFIVEMQQEGKDTITRLAEAEEAVQQTQTDMQMAIAELTMVIAALTETFAGGGENV